MPENENDKTVELDTSGPGANVELPETINEEDKTLESNGIKIIIDDQSLRYLAGTELDFVREGLNAGFKFNNPNVEESCGCGESFSLKEEMET